MAGKFYLKFYEKTVYDVTTNQVEPKLLDTKIGVHILMDSTPHLESIGFWGQIGEKALRQSIALFKQQLEDGDIDQYLWIDGS